MRSIDELERLYQALAAAPTRLGKLHLICLRKPDGVHETPGRAHLHAEHGLVGDRWIDKPGRDVEEQITLMNVHVAELIRSQQPLHAAGDNFLVDLALDTTSLPAGTRLRLGGALLEISAKPHTGCKKFSARFGLAALTWVSAHKDRRLRGVNCRVLSGGEVAVGDPVVVL
jgi:MOSC domain-containing protein YiiM